MTATLHALWVQISGFLSTPIGTGATILAVYLLLQLVILPKMGVST